MPDPPAAGSPRSARAGLCDFCEHQQLVANTRGSTFSLCRLSREDPSYPRYPRIPVLECGGYRAVRPPIEDG
jgi:hypothetical protein